MRLAHLCAVSLKVSLRKPFPRNLIRCKYYGRSLADRLEGINDNDLCTRKAAKEATPDPRSGVGRSLPFGLSSQERIVRSRQYRPFAPKSAENSPPFIA